VNWNTRELLRDCLQSIEAKTRRTKYEIIIIDNASKDSSAEMVKEAFPHVKLIESSANLGFAKANNQGIANSKDKYILFLNPDTKILSNALDGMVEFMENEQSYGAVGCKLTTPEAGIQFTCARAFPTLLNQLSEFLFFHRLFPHQRRLPTVELSYWNHQNSCEIDCLSGACIMSRRSIIQNIGGFSEEYFMYAEDVDLCYRIRKMGWKIYYLAEEEILHFGGASSEQRNENSYSAVMIRESNYRFMKIHYGGGKAFVFRLLCGVTSSVRLYLAFIAAIIYSMAKDGGRTAYTNLSKKHLALIQWSFNMVDLEEMKK